MPRLWNTTMDAHRHAVREAILDSAWALVADHGLLSVTMSRIAAETGIGRATLYKYFSSVEDILVACHERQLADHLEQLAALRDTPGEPAERLQAVLHGFALICYRRQHHGDELGALLHRGERVTQAQQQLLSLIRSLLVEVAGSGALREDATPEELARYCFHALTAAGGAADEGAVRRLVTVTSDALHSRY